MAYTQPESFRQKVDSLALLYQQGLTDKKIAAILHTSTCWVSKWRRKMGLVSNTHRRRLICESRLRRLYDAGLSDNEVAEAIHAPTTTVRRWRIRAGLSPNYQFGGNCGCPSVRARAAASQMKNRRNKCY